MTTPVTTSADSAAAPAANAPSQTASTEHLFHNYARLNRAFTHGQGCWLYDEQGTRMLDVMAGIGVNSLGHAHPKLVDTLKDQAERFWHCSNLYHIREQEQLAEVLARHSFADKVLVCNSGVEAVEGMIKLARRWQFEQGHPERQRIITVDGAFHGRTLATISAVRDAKLTLGFGHLLDGFDVATPSDTTPQEVASAVEALITDQTAGIMIEPVQGEGGVVDLIDSLPLLRGLADRHGILLLLDEVQSGVGRTGKLYAHEWAGVAPDALATAKGLGGGFPIGALLATQAMASGFPPGSHGTTFGGNPLASSVAVAVLEELTTPAFLANVIERGEQIVEGLQSLCRKYPQALVRHRGRGLFCGIEANAAHITNLQLMHALLDQRVLTVPARDNVLRLLPPLIITAAEVEFLLRALEGAVESLLLESADASARETAT